MMLRILLAAGLFLLPAIAGAQEVNIDLGEGGSFTGRVLQLIALMTVLSLAPEQMSRYRLRRSKRDDHFCTAEVAALCLELADDQQAAGVLDAYLDVFTAHYLGAKFQLPIDPDDAPHSHLKAFL